MQHSWVTVTLSGHIDAAGRRCLRACCQTRVQRRAAREASVSYAPDLANKPFVFVAHMRRLRVQTTQMRARWHSGCGISPLLSTKMCKVGRTGTHYARVACLKVAFLRGTMPLSRHVKTHQRFLQWYRCCTSTSACVIAR